MKNKPIYVAYIGVGDSDQHELENVMKSAYESLNSIFNDKDGEVIFIPIRGTDSRFECINPKYITEDELIRKNRLLIDELHEHLDSHLKQLTKDDKKVE
jgi:hypothetical protein